MSERYPFANDRPLVPSLIINESEEWNPDENMDYTTNNLTETINDTYETAVGENTQYYSVLDNTLDNLSINLPNPKIEPAEDLSEIETGEANDQQVVLFTVEGSDEYYGIQLAQDEDGNIRKYQFQFKQLENGQFEAIPESIQLLQDELEDDCQPPAPLENEKLGNVKIYVSENNENEHILPDNFENQNPEQEQSFQPEITVMYDNKVVETEILDDKTGLLQSIKKEKVFGNIKQEKVTVNYYDEQSQQHDEENMEFEEQLSEIPSFFSSSQESIQSTQIFQQQETTTLPEISVNEENYITNNNETQNETNRNTLPEVSDDVQEIINEPEIPQQLEQNELQEVPTSFQLETLPLTDFEPDKLCNTTILKDTLKAYKDQTKPKKEKLLYFIVQHPEKENVHSISFDNKVLQKCGRNPRSILKTSHSLIDLSKQQHQQQQSVIEYATDERLNKRFSRGKEAVQARLFNNFINKTTIPQAPVRKDRLPRKQKIKPVERQDEEIIVKEVMVSSQGFVEPGQNLKNIDSLAITSYVELSDSDDDYDNKKESNKKNKNQTGTSDDGEESEASIINLDSDEEMNNKDDEEDEEDNSSNNNKNDDNNEDTTPPKKRRGRPPKNRTLSSEKDKSIEDLESPLKRIRVETSEDEKKTEIQCPKCPKTFPSQNSLKTHLQHHNLENTIRLRSRASEKTEKPVAAPQPKTVEYKYKCDKCQNTFKNNALLSRHTCTSKNNNNANKKITEKSQIIICPICKKKFADSNALNIHKRIHIKERLLQSTENNLIVKITPKKFKSPKIVKPLVPKIISSFVKSPRKLRPSTTTNANPIRRNTGMLRASTAIIKRSPQKPKLRTASTSEISPNKTLRTPSKTPNYKRRAPHGGVPVPPRLRNIFTGLKKKLQEFDATDTGAKEENKRS